MSGPDTEDRTLNAAELVMVDATRPPAIDEKSNEELTALVHRLRQAQSQARDIGKRQKREMRGKAAPHGATPAKENAGTDGEGAGVAGGYSARRPGAFEARGGGNRAAELMRIRNRHAVQIKFRDYKNTL